MSKAGPIHVLRAFHGLKSACERYLREIDGPRGAAAICGAYINAGPHEFSRFDRHAETAKIREFLVAISEAIKLQNAMLPPTRRALWKAYGLDGADPELCRSVLLMLSGTKVPIDDLPEHTDPGRTHWEAACVIQELEGLWEGVHGKAPWLRAGANQAFEAFAMEVFRELKIEGCAPAGAQAIARKQFSISTPE